MVNIKKEFKYSKTVFEGAIPLTGIEIPGILSIGAKVGLIIHGDVKFDGSATVSFGCKTSLPNGGKISLVLIGGGKCGVEGLKLIEAKPDVTFGKGYIDLDATTIPESTITYGIEILGGAGIEAGIKLGLPIDLSISAGHSKSRIRCFWQFSCYSRANASFFNALENGGWCSGNSVTTGVTVDADASFKLDFGVWEGNKTPIFNIPLLVSCHPESH